MIGSRLVSCTILFLLVLSIFGSMPIEAQGHDFSPTVDVTTDRAIYKPGEAVTISGRYYCSICGKGFAAQISISIFSPDGFEGAQPTECNDAGYYSWTIGLLEKATPGTYTVRVTASREGSPAVENAKTFTVAGGILTVSVKTDKATYSELPAVVTVWGFVDCDGVGVEGATVTIKASTPVGEDGPWTAETDAFGGYTKRLSLSEDAALGPYSISVTASKEGYGDGVGQTGFEVKAELVVTASTDKAAYSIGETVTVFGNVKSGSQYVSDATVSIEIDGQGGGTVGKWEVTTKNGHYEQSLLIADKAPLGTYNVFVSAHREGYEDASAPEISFKVEKSKSLTVTVQTDKKVYQAGGSVKITGSVVSSANGESVQGAKVTIEVQYAGGSLGGSPWTVDSGALGYYEKTIGLLSDAPPDTYIVIVKASKEGYGDASTKTSFTVELPPLGVIFEHCLVDEASVVHVQVRVEFEIPDPYTSEVQNVWVEGAKVTVVLTTPDKTATIVPESLMTNYQGGVLFLVSLRSFPYGTYKVEATASREGFKTGQSETSFKFEPSLRIDLTAPEDRVVHGESGYILGVVTDSKQVPVVGATIRFWVISTYGTRSEPYGTTSGTGGVWEGYVETGDDAEPGLRIVEMQASKEGYESSDLFVVNLYFDVEGERKTLEGLMQGLYSKFGVEAKCPVNILITDSNGRCDGCFSNGTLVHDIPESYFNMHETDDGRYWLFGLPEATYSITITGTGDGTFNLRLALDQNTITEYGEQPITKDSNAVMNLDPDNPAPPLMLSNGEVVEPSVDGRTYTPSSYTEIWTVSSTTELSVETVEDSSGGPTGLAGVTVVIIILLAVTLAWRKRKKTSTSSDHRESTLPEEV